MVLSRLPRQSPVVAPQASRSQTPKPGAGSGAHTCPSSRQHETRQRGPWPAPPTLHAAARLGWVQCSTLNSGSWTSSGFLTTWVAVPLVPTCSRGHLPVHPHRGYLPRVGPSRKAVADHKNLCRVWRICHVCVLSAQLSELGRTRLPQGFCSVLNSFSGVLQKRGHSLSCFCSWAFLY